MDLSTAYRYNQNMMEYYTCKFTAGEFPSENIIWVKTWSRGINSLSEEVEDLI
jgi:hypothetical protein